MAIVMHYALQRQVLTGALSLDPRCTSCVASRQKVAEARMRKRKTLSLRVSAEFKKKLVEEAKREKRSVTSYIEVMLGKLWEEGAARNKQ